MSLTYMEIADINAKRNEEYIKSISAMKAEMAMILKEVKLPDYDNAKDENKNFIEKVNALYSMIQEYVNAKIIKDDMEYASLRKQERDLFPFLNMSVFDGDMMDEERERKVDTNRRSLQEISSAYERLQAQNQGEAFLDQELGKACEVIGKITNIKNLMLARKKLHETEYTKFALETMTTKIGRENAQLLNYIEKVKKNMGGKFDFTKTVDEYNKAAKDAEAAKKKAEEARKVLEEQEAVVEKPVADLLEVKSAKVSELAKIGTDITVLKAINLWDEQFTGRIVERNNKAGEWMKKAEELKNKVGQDIQDIELADKELKDNLKKIETYKADLAAINTKEGYDKKKKAVVDEVFKNEKEEARYKEICELLMDTETNALFNYWLVDYNKKSAKDFAIHVAEKEKELAKTYADNPKNETYLNTKKAKRIIDKLSEKLNKPVHVLKKELCNGNDKNLYAKYHDKYIAMQNANKALIAKGSDKNINLEEVIDSIRELNLKKEIAESNVKELTAIKKRAKAKYDEDLKIFKANEIYDEAEDDKKFLRDTIKEFENLCKGDMLKKEISEKLAGKVGTFDKLLKLTEGKKGGGEYDAIFAEVLSAGVGLQTAIKEKKAALETQAESNKNDINEIDKKIEEVKKALAAEKKSKYEQLQEKALQAKAKCDILRTATIEQVSLKLEYVKLKEDVREYTKKADELIAEIDKDFTNNVLNEMLAKYRCLNDARYQKRNSPEYRSMVEPLCALFGKTVPERGDDLRKKDIDIASINVTKMDLANTLVTIKKYAEEYLVKKKEIGSNPSKQRVQRFAMANQLIKLCDDSLMQLGIVNQKEHEITVRYIKPFQEEAKVFNEVANLKGAVENNEDLNFGKMLNIMSDEYEAKLQRGREKELQDSQNNNPEVKNESLENKIPELSK